MKGYLTREMLATLAHQQWSGWMEYLFEKSTLNDDGTVAIPKWAVERWTRQMNTEYKDLPDDEKESNGTEADKVIDCLHTWSTVLGNIQEV